MALTVTPPIEAEQIPDANAASKPQMQKRKRAERTFAELEVDVKASEPLSKKAERKSKRRKSVAEPESSSISRINHSQATSESDKEQGGGSSKRSEHGMWIGNLPWTATKADVREFFSNAGVLSDQITRVHLPLAKRPAAPKPGRKSETLNKGFAYVDFTTRGCVDSALALSETLLQGRRVLIKDATNFEGRPAVSKASTLSGKPPNKRVFVGNLEFDTTEDELRRHFGKCGEISIAFVATFQDSGNCKGYAWITFADIGSAQTAVRGWVDQEGEDEGKAKRWWVHRLRGRNLRVEFGEDDQVRYKKRYGGKDATTVSEDPNGANGHEYKQADVDSTSIASEEPQRQKKPKGRIGNTDASDQRPKSQLSAPSVVDRLTGAMVESQGKRVVFN